MFMVLGVIMTHGIGRMQYAKFYRNKPLKINEFRNNFLGFICMLIFGDIKLH
jgi:hypothetical protein